jgi:hypothetical protein
MQTNHDSNIDMSDILILDDESVNLEPEQSMIEPGRRTRSTNVNFSVIRR